MIWDELLGDLTEAHHFALEKIIKQIAEDSKGTEPPVIAEIGRKNSQITVAVAQICSEIVQAKRPSFLSFDETFDHRMSETLRDQGWHKHVRFFNYEASDAAEEVEDGLFDLVIINATDAVKVERMLWDWTQKLVVGGKVVGIYDDYSVLGVKKVTKGKYTRIGDNGCLWLVNAFTR